ncbi:hypothetical protein LIER_31825 [Lithospermum erythrorhizon]|uniref:Uncharacterized protein n=1 Tax=Lithospermum erythrorhizon TaxID=34254 RepID=A0AAV3RT45_LITER
MSDTSNSRPEGQGYNSDARSSSSPQASSSLVALARVGPQYLFKSPLASRAPSSFRHPPPPQLRVVRANINHCGSELSEKDLVDLRSDFGIPSSVILHRLKATE